MKRNLEHDLWVWREKEGRKPLLLQGARQVGKTYSLKKFGREVFARFRYVNFEEREQFISVFESNLDPRRILRDLALIFGESLDVQSELLILDEIQQCPRALTSLKYFAEDMPELAVCAAGSLLGVHLGESPFPVGKVDELRVHPLSFEEFLMAGPNGALYEAFSEVDTMEPLSETLHAKLWEELVYYLVVGGLPEAVSMFMRSRESLPEALDEARAVQSRLVSNYVADMAKHCGEQNAMHLDRLWRSIPAQLGRDQNGSAPKFVFKDVLPGIRGYARMAGVIDWLEAAGLLFRLPIVNRGALPFTAYEKDNFFKLFVFDVGILGALSKLPVRNMLDYDYGSFKGYMAENFVMQEFVASGRDNLACWREGQAEIEFLCVEDGRIVPVEVKSGWVTQSKSLKAFADKYKPPCRVVFSGRNMSRDLATGKHNYPLYLAGKFPLSIREKDHE